MPKLSSNLLNRLRRLLPAGEVALDPDTLAAHAGDKWHASHAPEAVVLAGSTDSVSKLMRLATRHGIPVTARGAGHGYVGGCVPVQGGIVLSLARMNRIKEIHSRDFVAVVEPGVVTATLQAEAEKQGLYYPPDPASRADCSLGGNIATNAGGPRCLKYGVTRDYVLGLEVVLANGDVVRPGGRTHKNKTGFDFARFFTGSEGLLGVVTEATLKLIPLPPYRACLSVGFAGPHSMVEAMQNIFGAGILPSALEVADSFTLAAARKRTGSLLLDGCHAHMIVELDGQKASVRPELRHLEAVVRRTPTRFILRGLGAAGCEQFWNLRREFSYALRDTGLTKLNEDIVVPRSRLEDLFAFAARLQKRHGLPVACFGHAGDGNIHVNIMVDSTKPGQCKRAELAVDALFEQVIAWDGAITGEHGIGLAKKRWWPLAASPEYRRLHQAIKRAVDPKGILNPGKFVK